MICQNLMPAVSGLEKEFPGKVKAANVDAFSDEGKKAVSELGFANHGLVIRDAEGKVLFKQADHSVNIDDVRDKLSAILE